MKLNRRAGTISAGDLKDRLTLLQPTYTPDGQGGNTVSYSPYGVVWCRAGSPNNTRQLQEAQLTFYDAAEFIIRFSQVPLTPDWQIEFQGKTYTIFSVYDIEHRYQYYRIIAYSKEL